MTPRPPEAPSQEKADGQGSLVRYLVGLANQENRGPLAHLRREAANWPNCGGGALEQVARFFGERPNPDREDAMLLVATLFALNPTTNDPPGADMGRVMRETGRQRHAEDSTEARFQRLLGARSPEELATYLRHAVQLAGGAGVPIGWSQLLKDVTTLLQAFRYGSADQRDWVIRRWARSYWSPDKRQDSPPEQP